MRFVLLLLALFATPAFAQTEPPVSARAQALFLELRCVVCQNQSIGDSDADVAKDLREIVLEQIASGRTDAEIKTFLVDRYGEFILLKPVFAWHTVLLWAAPLVLLLLGLYLAWSRRSTTTVQASTALSAEEEARLAKLIDRES